MNARTLIALAMICISAMTTGCVTIVVRPGPTYIRPPAVLPIPQPPRPDYLRGGSTCKLVDSSYRFNPHKAEAVKKDVEECWWLRPGETGRQQTCHDTAKFVTKISSYSVPGTIPETELDRVTNCTWNEGYEKCRMRIHEEYKLIPIGADRYGKMTYRYELLNKPKSPVNCH